MVKNKRNYLNFKVTEKTKIKRGPHMEKQETWKVKERRRKKNPQNYLKKKIVVPIRGKNEPDSYLNHGMN